LALNDFVFILVSIITKLFAHQVFLVPFMDLMSKSRHSVFYHIARFSLSEAVPANQAPRCHVDESPFTSLLMQTWTQATHATTDWRKSATSPALLQLIYGTGPSSSDTERCYRSGWLRDADADDVVCNLSSNARIYVFSI